MPQPYNYALTVPNPTQALTQGLQAGAAIGDIKAQATARDAAAQAAQAKAQRTQQFQQALVGIGANPTAKQLSGLLVQYPEMSELFKESYSRLSTEEQKERTSQASSVYTAVLAGDTDLAKNQLNEYAAAYRNAGREDDAKALEAKAKLIDLHPEAAERGVSLWLANAMGPEKFADTFGKLQDQRRARNKEGAELTKAEAEAQEAVIKTNFAERVAQAGLNLTEQQTRNLYLDGEFKRANTKVLVTQAKFDSETNPLKKRKLQGEVDAAQAAVDEKLRTRVADAKGAAAAIDNGIDTAEKLLQTDASTFGALRRATGPAAALTPTMTQSTAQFEERIKTLQSQVFLSQVAQLKGLGALSNAEGEKLDKALTSLSLRQGADSLLENLHEVQRLMLIARDNVSTRYGIALGTPNTPAAASHPDSDETNALVGGANTGGSSARY